MLRRLVFGMAAIILSSTLLYGESPAPGDPKADSDFGAKVREALKSLDSSNDNTAASRIALAKVAIEHNAWEAARDVLADAARLEPTNPEVAELMKQVVKKLPPPPPATTKPAVPPPTTNPAAPVTKPAPPEFTVKREVTPAEINRIKQLEWQADEKPIPTMRIDVETRNKFLAASPDVSRGDFNKMTPDAQAALILASDKKELYGGVKITTDPKSIKDFKMNVNNVVVKNCASCHVANKAGRFSLYTDKSDAAVYTNFLILQNYTAVVGGAERLMVDRTNPEGSLLAQFMLPDKVADVPHPNVPDFKVAAKTVSDPKYQIVLKWLKSLDPIAPKYGIDVSNAEEPAKPAAKGG